MEQEESLGKRLAAARHAQGREIDALVYQHGFPRGVIEALESDNYGYFSSPVYARSFLKQYGQLLGVDVSEIIDSLEPTPIVDLEPTERLFASQAEEVFHAAPRRSRSHAKATASTWAGGGGAAIMTILIPGLLVYLGLLAYRWVEREVTQERVVQLPSPDAKPAEPPPQPVIVQPALMPERPSVELQRQVPRAVPVEEDEEP